MWIDLLAMEQQFILLALIEMTLPTQTSLMVSVWFDSRESKGWTVGWLGRNKLQNRTTKTMGDHFWRISGNCGGFGELSWKFFSMYFRHKNEQMAAAHLLDAFSRKWLKNYFGADEPLFVSSSGRSVKQYCDLSLSAIACDVVLLLLCSVFR